MIEFIKMLVREMVTEGNFSFLLIVILTTHIVIDVKNNAATKKESTKLFNMLDELSNKVKTFISRKK